MSHATLRRYTKLAVALHALRAKVLTLLSPERWEDKNDIAYLRCYQEQLGARAVLALCFADAPEKYHHWKIYSPGMDGVCLEFEKEALLRQAQLQGIRWGVVRYRELKEAKRVRPDVEQLPFMKRYPYEGEDELRLIYVDPAHDVKTKDMTINAACIQRITLSPGLPDGLIGSVVATLREALGRPGLPIHRTTLLDNMKWQRLAQPQKGPVKQVLS